MGKAFFIFLIFLCLIKSYFNTERKKTLTDYSSKFCYDINLRELYYPFSNKKLINGVETSLIKNLRVAIPLQFSFGITF